MPLNAFGLQGKGRAAGIYPKSVLRSPQKCVSHPPPSPCLGHKAAGPVGLGGGSGSSVPCTGPGWAQSGRGQEQPPGIRALISAPAGAHPWEGPQGTAACLMFSSHARTEICL